MSRRLALAFSAAVAAALAQAAASAASPGTACASLAALTIPNVTIRSATAVAAGPFTPPAAPVAADGGVRTSVSMTLPAFCRVEATARPTSVCDKGLSGFLKKSFVVSAIARNGERRLRLNS